MPVASPSVVAFRLSRRAGVALIVTTVVTGPFGAVAALLVLLCPFRVHGPASPAVRTAWISTVVVSILGAVGCGLLLYTAARSQDGGAPLGAVAEGAIFGFLPATALGAACGGLIVGATHLSRRLRKRRADVERSDATPYG